MYTLAEKVRSSNFGNLTLYDFSSRQCLLSFHRICGHQAVLTSTLSTDLGHRPAASLSVAGAQHWWTEAAFAAPFAAFGMALTTSLTMQLTCLRACVRAKDGQVYTSTYCDNIQPYDKRRFSFCQMWHDFLIVFCCKLPQIWTFEFRKVVRQHTEDMLGNVIWVLLAI